MVKLESFIQSVLVFDLGAEITRKVSLPSEGLDLPARVALDGLPLCLFDASLGARIEAQARVRDISVDVSFELKSELEYKELETVYQRQAELAQERDRLQSWIGTLGSLGVPPRPPGMPGEIPPPSFIDSRKSLLVLKRQEILEKREALEDIRQELRSLEKRASVLTEFQRKDRRVQKMAILTIEGQGHLSSDSLFFLSYRVPGARWAPSYVMRFKGDLSSAVVQLRVSVAQNTGEDWNDVALSVTTAQAQARRQLPELASLRIGRKQAPPPPPRWREPPKDTAALFSDFDRNLESAGEVLPGSMLVGHQNEVLFAEPPEPPRGMVDSAELRKERSAGLRDRKSTVFAEGGWGGGELLGSKLSAPSESVPIRAASAAAPVMRMPKQSPAAPRQSEVTIPDPSLQEYARLVMPGPYEHGRGKLRYQSLKEQVSLKARELGLLETRFLQEVDRAVAQAEGTGMSFVPPGFSNPRWPGEDSFDLYFEGESNCSISSDGNFHSRPLQDFELEFESRFVAVPRETKQVFRTVKASSPLPLPEGPADVYLGKNFLLSGPIKGVPPGGLLRLALGAEEGIKIVRNTRFKESTSGMVSKTRRLEHIIGLEVVNNLGREALIEVRERLPQAASMEKEVDVQLISSNPPWEGFEPEDQPGFEGAYRWMFRLEPGAKQDLEAVYTIAIPAKYDLRDGNRRE